MAKGDKPIKPSTIPSRHKRTLRESQSSGGTKSEETFLRLFWKGFSAPVRYIWKALGWISHRPPLKQIGHALRWFFTRKPVKFIGRFLGLRFIRDSFRELRTVSWPSLKESFRLTGAVVIFAVAFGLFVAVIDFGLDKLFKQILLK